MAMGPVSLLLAEQRGPGLTDSRRLHSVCFCSGSHSETCFLRVHGDRLGEGASCPWCTGAPRSRVRLTSVTLRRAAEWKVSALTSCEPGAHFAIWKGIAPVAS